MGMCRGGMRTTQRKRPRPRPCHHDHNTAQCNITSHHATSTPSVRNHTTPRHTPPPNQPQFAPHTHHHTMITPTSNVLSPFELLQPATPHLRSISRCPSACFAPHVSNSSILGVQNLIRVRPGARRVRSTSLCEDPYFPCDRFFPGLTQFLHRQQSALGIRVPFGHLLNSLKMGY